MMKHNEASKNADEIGNKKNKAMQQYSENFHIKAASSFYISLNSLTYVRGFV
jgi:hypothetical protein